MLRDAIHGSEFMKTAPNETVQKVVQILDDLGPGRPAKLLASDEATLSQDAITDRMHIIFKSA